jgi:hypothetical protein
VPTAGDEAEGIDDLRAALAGEIWQQEKGYAVGVLLFGWALKVSARRGGANTRTREQVDTRTCVHAYTRTREQADTPIREHAEHAC